MPHADPVARAEYAREYQRGLHRDPVRHAAVMARQRAVRLERSRAQRFVDNANRRARDLGISERLLSRDVAPMTGPCAYCGGTQETWDHVIPLARGGGNNVGNLAPTCHPCNRVKHSRTPEEWVR